MTLSEQTTADLGTMLEATDQRLHEMTCTPEAVNTYSPAEVAALWDLRDTLGAMLPD
ncbi:hypothetical protein SAMN05421665_1230 [Yoonia rosea]|uniref:Uncharacterized protein n=1 Tax=Yoonia rosea TaxID=287098 RepID=A0A1R3WSC7_9RHOB|nr:hypothetical protein [Yoonia rosea]SIT81185.1 hypothetical protein SAMN05421665_1230 [Yoonia rosea]